MTLPKHASLKHRPQILDDKTMDAAAVNAPELTGSWKHEVSWNEDTKAQEDAGKREGARVKKFIARLAAAVRNIGGGK